MVNEMINQKGYIYTNKDGKFLQRSIERGYLDSVHYVLTVVDQFNMNCLFEHGVKIKDGVDLDNGLKYRTLFAEDVVKSLHCSKVSVVREMYKDWVITVDESKC